MKPFSLAFFVAGLVAGVAPAATVEKPWFKKSPAGQKALKALRESVQSSDEPNKQEHASRQATFRAALRQASEIARDNVLLQDVVATTLDKANRDSNADVVAEELESGIRQAVELLSFEPVIEADLPKGFPSPTPVGEIAVKNFPAYRAARTNMNGEAWAFWRLFAHITSNQIAMTAPVEVTYSRPSRAADEPIERVSMAFLYGDPNLGQTTIESDVAVVDLPPACYLSLGMRGDWNSPAVAAAQQYLERWMEAHVGEYKIAGNLRMMGYNSPKVPVSNRYFEVELPIEPLDRSDASKANAESNFKSR